MTFRQLSLTNELDIQVGDVVWWTMKGEIPLKSRVVDLMPGICKVLTLEGDRDYHLAYAHELTRICA